MQLQQFVQLLGEALGVLQILHAQCAARHLVFVGRANALARGADLAVTTGLAQQLSGLVHFNVERQDQRAGFADEQARTHVQARGFQALDLEQQVGRIHHHAIADIAGHAIAHDARGDQLQRGFLAIDDQRVTGIVTTLKTHHARSMVGEPVDDLALAFVTPLGADDDDIAAG